MYRVALILKNGTPLSQNFKERGDVDEFILTTDDKLGVKRYRIMNKETGEVLETEQGKIGEVK